MQDKMDSSFWIGYRIKLPETPSDVMVAGPFENAEVARRERIILKKEGYSVSSWIVANTKEEALKKAENITGII